MSAYHRVSLLVEKSRNTFTGNSTMSLASFPGLPLVCISVGYILPNQKTKSARGRTGNDVS